MIPLRNGWRRWEGSNTSVKNLEKKNGSLAKARSRSITSVRGRIDELELSYNNLSMGVFDDVEASRAANSIPEKVDLLPEGEVVNVLEARFLSTSKRYLLYGKAWAEVG
jgi:hypothetical protein